MLGFSAALWRKVRANPRLRLKPSPESDRALADLPKWRPPPEWARP
jgi:hypothetical protein